MSFVRGRREGLSKGEGGRSFSMEVGSNTPGKSTGLSCMKGQTHSEDWEWKGGEFRYLQHRWCGDFLNSGSNQNLLD